MYSLDCRIVSDVFKLHNYLTKPVYSKKSHFGGNAPQQNSYSSHSNRGSIDGNLSASSIYLSYHVWLSLLSQPVPLVDKNIVCCFGHYKYNGLSVISLFYDTS